MRECGIVKWLVVGLVAGSLSAAAESPNLQEDLTQALAELSRVRESISSEKIPMVKGLNSLEDKLMEVRVEHQKVSRQLDGRNLDLNNLRSEINTRKQERSYLSSLLGEYGRNFETRLHISEMDLYEEVMRNARLAVEDSNLSASDVYMKQIDLVESSIIRLQNAIGGSMFAGSAVCEDGLVKHGQVVLVGPVAMFVADDGKAVGIAEQRLGSLEPAILPMGDQKHTEMIRELVTQGSGTMPFDPSLGNARKIEETSETLGEHIAKGGKVMFPILGMFAVAMAIAVAKWVQLARVPMPSDRQVDAALSLIAEKDMPKLKAKIEAMKGPTGDMLMAGFMHLEEPKDLIEEVMFEEMLTTRLKLEKFTSFISVCAASAPLLGLLGTVTGIINTFKLITVFGSGDVKTLSGGISEALITTEFGLIVAIPSLVFYAFLSRKTKAISDRMEQVAILFMNRISRGA
jgi:biopolymer transport protein ExbB